MMIIIWEVQVKQNEVGGRRIEKCSMEEERFDLRFENEIREQRIKYVEAKIHEMVGE